LTSKSRADTADERPSARDRRRRRRVLRPDHATWSPASRLRSPDQGLIRTGQLPADKERIDLVTNRDEDNINPRRAPAQLSDDFVGS
jgi:hypothetical protein